MIQITARALLWLTRGLTTQSLLTIYLALMQFALLSEEEKKAAIRAADSDLKYLLADTEVDDDLQVQLFHAGVRRLRIFATLAKDGEKIGEFLNKDFGLDPEHAGQALQDLRLRCFPVLTAGAHECERTADDRRGRQVHLLTGRERFFFWIEWLAAALA